MGWRQSGRWAALMGLTLVVAATPAAAVASPLPLPILDHFAVAGWGTNTDAQLGDGTTTNPVSPVAAIGLAKGMRQVDGGYLHGLALDHERQVWSWGRNDYGQLGLGYSDLAVHHTVAEKVIDLAGAVQVSAGQFHNLAVRSDGEAWAWGLNASGQLGDGTMDSTSTPAPVPGVTDIVQVSAGAAHSLALRADGTVWAWGDNVNGQVGTDLNDGLHPTPEQVSGLDGIIQISAGAEHSLALGADGTVWAWGFGGHGQLGNGALKDAFVPAQAAIRDVIQISAGGFHSLALRADGSVYSWGDNRFLQLGDGSDDDQPWPVPVEYLNTGKAGIQMIDAGYTHSLVLTNTGYVWTWGLHVSGGTWTTYGTPWPVPGPSDVRHVSGGWLFTLIVLKIPPVACPDRCRSATR